MVERPSKLVRVAYHEAGHAVIAMELRLPFKNVSVIEDDDSLGRVVFIISDRFRPDINNDARTALLIEKHIKVGLAGLAAEHKLTERHNWRGASGDIDSAIDLAMYRFPPEVVGPYIDYLKALVRANMNRPFTWKSVERLAQALLEERQMSARTARKIIKSAWTI